MLRNISVRYDPLEDRMAVSFEMSGPEGPADVHALHITRRVCAAWRGDLQAMVDLSAQPPERLPQSAKAALSQAHHQAMSSQAKVSTQAPQRQPQATRAPDLVTKIHCGRRRKDGRWVMQFERRDKPPIGLMLSSQTLHALIDALSRRVQTARWALDAIPVEDKRPPESSTGSQLH